MTARKKPSQKQLVAKADALFSLVVRSPGVCANCGSHDYLQCAHGFSRRYRAVRWDEGNAWCLCRNCHFYFTGRPHEWEEWMQSRLGYEAYRDLQKRALSTAAKVDLPAVLARLIVRSNEIAA